MESREKVVELVSRINGRVVVGSDITDEDIKDLDIESLVAAIMRYYEGDGGIKILNRESLEKIIKLQQSDKKPVDIEVVRESSFKPVAKEYDANFSIRKRDIERTAGAVQDFADYFKDRFYKLREFLRGNGVAISGMLNGIEDVAKYTNGREISIVGIVYDKITTKNNNILMTLEDETGTAKVIFMNTSNAAGKKLFEDANRIVRDEVIAVRGKISGPFVIANAMLWPDVPVHLRKQSEVDTAIALLSDLHAGSKLFMDKNFGTFLKWLNGKINYKLELASKIKYMFLAGDIADGIGVYPNQDRDLAIVDIYKQYSFIFDLLQAVPDYIHVFVMPGNHDAVPLSEPQPQLPEEFFKDFASSNIHMLQNPSYVTVEKSKILAYHGASLDSMTRAVPGCSYANPEIAMVEILKRRHLSPIYGGNAIAPTRGDTLVIDEVPDILHMGHIHKNGYSDYHGTLVINSGTWQARTEYQVKQGHIPSPALLPVYETKSTGFSIVNFNTIGD